MKLGELLVSNSLVTQAELEYALENQKKTKKRLGTVLVELGLIKEEVLLKFLGEKFGLPTVDFSQFQPNPEVVNLVPASICKKLGVLPVDKFADILSLVMVDPTDDAAKEEIANMTNCRIEPLISSEQSILDAMKKYLRSSGGSDFTESEDEKTAQITPKDVKLPDWMMSSSAVSGDETMITTKEAISEASKEPEVSAESEDTAIEKVESILKDVDDIIVSNDSAVQGTETAAEEVAEEVKVEKKKKVVSQKDDQRVQEIDTKLDDYDSTIEELVLRLNKIDKNIGKIKSQADVIASKISDKNQDIGNLQSVLDARLNEVEKFGDKMNHVIANFDKLIKNYNGSVESYNKISENYNKITKAIGEAVKKYNSVAGQINSVHSKYQTLLENMHTSESKIDDISKDIENEKLKISNALKNKTLAKLIESKLFAKTYIGEDIVKLKTDARKFNLYSRLMFIFSIVLMIVVIGAGILFMTKRPAIGPAPDKTLIDKTKVDKKRIDKKDKEEKAKKEKEKEKQDLAKLKELKDNAQNSLNVTDKLIARMKEEEVEQYLPDSYELALEKYSKIKTDFDNGLYSDVVKKLPILNDELNGLLDKVKVEVAEKEEDQKKKEEEEAKKKKEEEERKRKEEAARKKKAEEERRKKEEAARKKREEERKATPKVYRYRLTFSGAAEAKEWLPELRGAGYKVSLSGSSIIVTFSSASKYQKAKTDLYNATGYQPKPM